MKTQSKFSGYNFEGSALNTLVDILAYNTYYQSFYNNMTFNEMFLDTASKRSSIVSLAKMLGYVPASTKSSKCVVELTASGAGMQDKLYISANKILKTIKDNESTEFVILDTIHLKPSSYAQDGTVLQISSGAVVAYEGKLKTMTFVHDEGLPFRKYILQYDNLDIDTLSVTVKESANSDNGIDDRWERVTDITKIKENSLCYFVEEMPYGYYCIYFGDGVLGKRLQDGNVITVSVIQTNGTFGNGIGLTNPSTTFRTDGGYNVNVLVPSSGGTERENAESIKAKAPKSFTTQERAVTADDYKNILYKEFTNLKSISTWGGEENDPPQYGKIFISVETQDGIFLSSEEKSKIVNSLMKSRAVVGIVPVVVDPEVLYLQLNTFIKSDLSKLNISKISLENNLKKKILTYVENNLGYFDGDFYANELVNEIDGVDSSIVGVTVIPTIEKRIVIDLYNPQNYAVYFKNRLSNFEGCKNSITSSSFYYYDSSEGIYRTCYLEDDANGIINIIYLDSNKNKVIFKQIGTVNYEKGEIFLEDFAPTYLIGTTRLRIYAAPNEKDIFSQRNTLIFMDKLDENCLSINVEYLPFRNKA